MNKKIGLSISLSMATMLMMTSPIYAYQKNETVYTKIDSKGKVTYQIVSDQISDSASTIEDTSNLTNINNISGNETYTKNGNKVIWKNKGKTIFYQGETSKELPLDVSIQYKLNGKEISLNELKGKSGTIDLNFNYTNHLSHTYQNQTLYTPMNVLLALNLDASKNTDVTVNTGKVMDNGKNISVIGLAAPGLYDSFNQMDELKELDHIHISFKTTSFNLDSILSVASPKLIDLDKINQVFDKFDSSLKNVNQLESASEQLVKGTSKLKQGTSDLYQATDKLSNGTNQLKNGSNTLHNGAKTYQSKMQDASSAANQLETQGVDQLVNHYAQIDTAIGQIVEKAGKYLNQDNVDKIVGGIGQATNGSKQVNDGINKLQTSSENGINQIIEGLNQSITQAYQKLATKMNLSVDTVKTLYANYQKQPFTGQTVAAFYHQAYNDQTKTLFDNQAISLNQAMSQIQVLELNNTQIIQALKQYQTQMNTNGFKPLQQGSQSLYQGLDKYYKDLGITTDKQNKYISPKLNQLLKEMNNVSKLSEGSSNFKTGLKTFSDNYKQLSQGIDALSNGFISIFNGTTQLNEGINQLDNGTNQLKDGAKQLKDGAKQLDDGMKQFKLEGINQLIKVSDKVKKQSNIMKQLEHYADTYSYTDKNNKAQLETKFVYVLEE